MGIKYRYLLIVGNFNTIALLGLMTI